jgi:hypothetical protein
MLRIIILFAVGKNISINLKWDTLNSNGLHAIIEKNVFFRLKELTVAPDLQLILEYRFLNSIS